MSPAYQASIEFSGANSLAQVSIVSTAKVKVVARVIKFDGSPPSLSVSINFLALGAVGWKSTGLGLWKQRFMPCVTKMFKTIMWHNMRTGKSCCRIDSERMKVIRIS